MSDRSKIAPGNKRKKTEDNKTQQPENNKKIKNYLILGKIAKGGMGEVYKGIHESLKKEVLIKKLLSDSSEILSERFKREASIMMDISHPNIVHIFDFFKENNSSYMAMEYINGLSLAEFMTESGPLSPYICCYFAMEIAKGLKYAHEKGIIHRDIKPGNIMISMNGEVKITDFGIAVKTERTEESDLTRTGTILGTPAYMSPEQIRSPKTVDYRTDIYSLGILMYEMLTGNRPYGNDFSMENIVNIRKGKYTPLRKTDVVIPDFLNSLIKKMIAPTRSARFNSLNSLINKCRFFIDIRFGSVNDIRKIISYRIKSGFKKYPVSTSLHKKGYKNGTIERNLIFKHRYNIITRSFKVFFLLTCTIVALVIVSAASPRTFLKVFMPDTTGLLNVLINDMNTQNYSSLTITKRDQLTPVKIIHFGHRSKQRKTINNIPLSSGEYTVIYSAIDKILIKDVTVRPVSENLPNDSIDFDIAPRLPCLTTTDFNIRTQNDDLINNYTVKYKISDSNTWEVLNPGNSILSGNYYDFLITAEKYKPHYINWIKINNNQNLLTIEAILIGTD